MANLYYLFTTGPKNNKNNYVYNNLSNIWWTPDGEDTVDKVKTMAFAGTTLGKQEFHRHSHRCSGNGF